MTRTATTTTYTEEQVATVLNLMTSITEQIVERLKCPHRNPMDVEATLVCVKCLSYRALNAMVEPIPGVTKQQERFRMLQNALVNSLGVFTGEKAHQISSVTAQARPIMHSWGW